MTPFRSRTFLARATGAAAMSLCAAWVAGVQPAQARDHDRIGGRELDRARDACHQIAENRGWRDIRTDVRDRDDDRGRVVVDVSGRRNGDDRDQRCTYDVRDDYAAFEDQYGDRAVERARDACRNLAEDRGWRDVRLEMRDRGRDGPVVMDVRGRRDGDDRQRECTYRPRDDRASFEDYPSPDDRCPAVPPPALQRGARSRGHSCPPSRGPVNRATAGRDHGPGRARALR